MQAEGGEARLRHLLEQNLIRGDYGIVGEPTGNRLEIATKGVLHVQISTKGRMAHGGKPWAGVNAIEHIARVIDALEPLRLVLARRVHPLVGAPSLTIGTIAGGTVPNMVASDCRMIIDRRITPYETSAEAIQEIEDILLRLTMEDPLFAGRLEVLLDWPSVEVPRANPAITALSRAIECVTGKEPDIGGKDGGTDAAWIFQATRIPMVHFSPGESHLVLTANERVNINAYVDAVEALVLTFEELLGLAGGESRPGQRTAIR